METMASILGMISSDAAPYAADVLARGVVLVGLCFGAMAVLRRAPAALRHQVWALGMVGLIALPFLASSLPSWELDVAGIDAVGAAAERVAAAALPVTAPAEPASRLAASGAPVGTGATMAEGTAPGVKVSGETRVRRTSAERAGPLTSLPAFLLAVWAAGAMFLLARLSIGLVRAARLVRRGRAVTDRRWNVLVSLLSLKSGLEENVRVVTSPEVNVPMAWGLLDTWLVLPEGIESWPEDRRRVVVLHELAHLRRRDCCVQALARIALAIHWPNPLAWMAVRRMCSEREQACDDAVLAAGVRGTAYAHHLIDIARGLGRAGHPVRAAVAMARPSELENRVLAILDERRSRHAAGRRATSLALAAFALLIVPVASVRPSAAAPGEEIAAGEATPPDVTKERVGERHPPGSDATDGSDVPSRESAMHAAASTDDGVLRLDVGARLEADLGPAGEALADFASKALGALQETASDTIDEQVYEALIRALGSEDASIRRQAANTLGVIESPRAVGALATVVRADESPGVRREAAWALGMIESTDGVDALAVAVRDTDVDVRETAVWALGMIESPAGIDALVLAADDADPGIREQVAWALGMIEAPAGVDPLLGLLDDTEPEVRDNAAWGLGMIESTAAVDGLARAFASESNADVRAQIIWALGMIEDRAGIDTVIDGLEDDDPDVRDKSLWALGMIMG